MNKEGLLNTTDQLRPVSAEIAEEYASKSEQLASLVTTALAARPDLERLIGPDNRQAMTDNHRNHGRFIASVLHRYDPEVLVDTVEHMEAELSATAFEAVRPLYEWMLVNQAAFVALSEQPTSTVWDEEPEH